MKNRLYNLDYLRGLAALSIMAFHYIFYTFGRLDASNALGRLGIYGVSIFYVLSGLTLYYVYHSKMETITQVTDFFRKRAFRIIPLLFFATIVSMILSKNFPGTMIVILNLTGLFGFVEWGSDIARGAWSIGNEVVFYFFFPLFILLLNKSKIAYWATLLILLIIYLYFAFFVMDKSRTILEQNNTYTNPLQHIFLFFGGISIGHFFKNVNIKRWLNLSIVNIAVLLFVFYPVSGNAINLITDWNRLVFTAICFVVTICFYRLTIHFPKFIETPLTMLGEASYSVYLLHPIVYNVFSIIAFKMNLSKVFIFSISIPVTLVSSYFCYQYFEKYFMNMGKQKSSFFHSPCS